MTEREQFLMNCVDKHRDRVFRVEQFIWQNPETGFREWKTSDYLEQEFLQLGYEVTRAEDIPGFYADLDTGIPGPSILIMGEMDALPCPGHPDAVNGVAHACGHNAQCAGLVGLAAALKEANALDGLSGRIRLMAVPAEELVELEYRQALRDKGTIHFLSGKAEFMSRGYMKGMDIAVLIHTRNLGKMEFFARGGSNGFVTKEVTYIGRAAHAASAPEDGINALYAATLGLQAVNSIRETFREDQKVRVHGVITDGGSASNVIPDRVRIEMQVRGAAIDVIRNVSRRVDQALIGAAVALGAEIEIENSPGYTPLKNYEPLMKVFEKCAQVVSGPEKVNIDSGNWSTGSTDMGDMCAVMPTIQPYATGAIGKGHGADYQIADPVCACLNSAKAEILLINALLENDGCVAKEIVESFVPPYSQDEYVSYLESCFTKVRPIQYLEGELRIPI